MSQEQKTLSRWIWWTVFLIGTFSLSLTFRAFKVFTLTPTLENGLALLGILFILGAALLVMLYDSYATEKAKGNIHHPFRFFEWVYERQQANKLNGGL